ncbi:hypothetical protein [Actinoplanes friuliensis]|uniref:hypothetical protein n=1 Tax=Actinoplanes friuliensis TaxID=196914 RepID=UPI0011DD6E6A|nr:hypothetical protein [Actinoplanes friuliensis]
MSTQWPAVASLTGSVLAALIGGSLGGFVARRHEGQRWTRDQRMSAYADLVRSYSEVYHRIASLDDDGQRGQPDWPAWNRSLAVVYVVAASEIANQARSIDEALWDLSQQSGTGRLPAEQWRALRTPLEAAVLQFLNLARDELGSLGEPLPKLWGRPDNYPAS